MRKTEMENTGTAIMYENYICELTENQTYMYSKEGACIICCRLSVICICLFRTETGVSHIYINRVHLLLDLVSVNLLTKIMLLQHYFSPFYIQ